MLTLKAQDLWEQGVRHAHLVTSKWKEKNEKELIGSTEILEQRLHVLEQSSQFLMHQISLCNQFFTCLRLICLNTIVKKAFSAKKKGERYECWNNTITRHLLSPPSGFQPSNFHVNFFFKKKKEDNLLSCSVFTTLTARQNISD